MTTWPACRKVGVRKEKNGQRQGLEPRTADQLIFTVSTGVSRTILCGGENHEVGQPLHFGPMSEYKLIVLAGVAAIVATTSTTFTTVSTGVGGRSATAVRV